MAPPSSSQYNSSSTLSQTQTLKQGISNKVKSNIGSFFKKDKKGSKPQWNNSVTLDKSLSFTDRSFKQSQRGDKNKNNVTMMTEEDEEDMKEVMKMMND